MKINKIDGVNYTSKTFTTADGEITLPGLTVRALRQLLDRQDPDAMVLYMAEQGEGLLFGAIAGAASLGIGAVAFFGPEAIDAIYKKFGDGN